MKTLPSSPDFGPGSVRFEIEMILSAEGKFARQLVRRFLQRGRDIAATNEIRFGMKTVGRDRFFDGENRRERFVFDHHFFGGGTTGFLRFTDNQRDDLAVIKRLLVRQQNFVVPHRADVVQTGHIFGEQNGGMPGIARAAETSRDKIFACACGEQTGQSPASVPIARGHRRKSLRR